MQYVGQYITHDGDQWEVVATGTVRDDTIYCHLKSVHRFRVQKNGKVPVQCADWIHKSKLEGDK